MDQRWQYRLNVTSEESKRMEYLQASIRKQLIATDRAGESLFTTVPSKPRQKQGFAPQQELRTVVGSEKMLFHCTSYLQA